MNNADNIMSLNNVTFLLIFVRTGTVVNVIGAVLEHDELPTYFILLQSWYYRQLP